MSLAALRKKQEVEDHGDWFDLPAPLGGRAFIAHRENPDFQARMRRYLSQLRVKFRGQQLSTEEMLLKDSEFESKLRDLMVGTILKEIENVREDAESAPMESTRENMRKLLDYRDVFDFVDRTARAMYADVEEVVEEAAKNSEASSAGD